MWKKNKKKPADWHFLQRHATTGSLGRGALDRNYLQDPNYYQPRTRPPASPRANEENRQAASTAQPSSSTQNKSQAKPSSQSSSTTQKKPTDQPDQA